MSNPSMLDVLEQLRRSPNESATVEFKSNLSDPKASRKELDDLLLPKLPEVLDAEQRAHKVRNLLQAMRRADLIERRGSKNAPEWRLKGPE